MELKLTNRYDVHMLMKSLQMNLSEQEVRYISHALSELTKKLESEIEKDPDSEDDLTPMYAEDVLNIRDVFNRIKEETTPVFGEQVLTVSYETLLGVKNNFQQTEPD